ncbi:hypothetical protein V5E97_06815 [Singulisphaera sp. Ch08]|uniref:Terminase small subunit n=1 Tax=Singulisphaera sp. Ch08 TaxID=3120278 RepID=A0AAU7CKQ1_9BACT
MAKRKTYPDDIERIEDDPNLKAWNRRPRESARAFAIFKAYCMLGAGRSAVLLKRRLGVSENYVKKLSARWDWVERARHYDSQIADAEQAAREKVAAQTAEKWARRRMESAEENWETAQIVGRKAREMFNGNLYSQEVDKDGMTIVIEPAKWTMATAGALLKLSAELRAAALGEALGETEDDFDPSKATPEECRAFLRKEGVLKALPAPEKKEE